MPRFLNPPSVPRPASNYSQAVALGAEYKRVIVSGQLGLSADGVLAEGLEAQMRQAFANFRAIVEAAGLTTNDVVKLTVFVTVPGAVGLVRAIREEMFGAHAPASTYLQVAGLADPSFLVEVEGEAVQEQAPIR